MIGTVTVFLTTRNNRVNSFFKLKNSLYLTILSIVILYSLFLHLLAKTGQEGLFGFRWMSSFLNSLGLCLCVFSLGLLFLFKAKRDNSSYRPFYIFISKSVVFLGVFYGFYTFLPISDYENWQYFGMIGLYSIVLRFVLLKINTAIIHTEEKLKQKIRLLVDFIFKTRNEHYMSVAVKAVAAEKNGPPIDGVSTEKQTEAFDEEMWNILDKLNDE